MNPRLTAIAGRLKGAVFSIEEFPVVIGRETAATLCLPTLLFRAPHADRKENDEFVILDLESLNGTFINDVPIKRRTLQHGDRVRIGDSQFLFLLHEATPAALSPAFSLKTLTLPVVRRCRSNSTSPVP